MVTKPILLKMDNNRTRELHENQRENILHFLLMRYKNNKLNHSAINEAAENFKVHRRTISRLWKRAQQSKKDGDEVFNVKSRKRGRCGPKKKDYSQQLEKIKDLPLNQRRTLRSLSNAVNIPRTTLYRIFKKGEVFKRVSSSIKPILTDENKIRRTQFCLQHVQPNGFFSEMMDVVHIDEKWFYITTISKTFYVSLDEPVPHRQCKSKRFITKVMFMAAVARPRWDPSKNEYFDGKIGIWPFTFKENAKRNSKNRSKGTPVTKVMETIGREEIRNMLIENVLPAIREKFPNSEKSHTVYIQQDNAQPVLKEELVKEGWTLQFKSQPPISPDLNVLDLGFFNSIQALQHQMVTRNIDELISAVEAAFQQLDRDTLDSVFLTLQTCMENIMLTNGNNSYKIPHINKEKLRRENRLPINLICNVEAVKNSKLFLNID